MFKTKFDTLPSLLIFIFSGSTLWTSVSCVDHYRAENHPSSSVVEQSDLGALHETSEDESLPMDYLDQAGEVEPERQERDAGTVWMSGEELLAPAAGESPGSPRCASHSPREFTLIAPEGRVDPLSACEQPHWGVGLPRGARWRFTVSARFSEERSLRLVSYAPGEVKGAIPASLDEVSDMDSFLEVEFDVSRSGEARFHIEVLNGDVWEPWFVPMDRDEVILSSSLQCLAGCELRSTRFPIILVHGYAGVDRFFGVFDYFYRVPQMLRAIGFQVFVPTLSPIETSEQRALQLSQYLRELTQEFGVKRFNLIAHSQGGLDSRILISGLEQHELIATLTTIATPHLGIPLDLPDFLSRQDFSPREMAVFNERYPQHEAVRYFSWSARTCTLLEYTCLRDHNREVVNAFLLATYTLLLNYGPNDGLVPTANMIYGEHLGVLDADHFDEIGQIANLGGGPFDHLTFYREEALRLRDAGF